MCAQSSYNSIDLTLDVLAEQHLQVTKDRIRGLVFDLDGTILDSMGHHWKAWEQVSKEYEFSLTKEKLLSMAGMPSTKIMSILCEEQGIDTNKFDMDAAALRKQGLYASFAEEGTTVIPFVMNLALEAKQLGIPMSIATGGSKLQVEKAMKSAQIHDFFDAVVTCDDVTHGKPHPETFLRAAELIEVEPQFCVGFEDADMGMQAIASANFLAAVDVRKLPGYPSL
jgi:beta-phosphoglucomutase family hydrolase